MLLTDFGDAIAAAPCRQVLSVYKGHKWAFIEEHIHDVLGKQSRDNEDFDLALQHFAAMLHCPHSPPYWQAHYLKQFMDTVALAEQSKVGPSCTSSNYQMPVSNSTQANEL